MRWRCGARPTTRAVTRRPGACSAFRSSILRSCSRRCRLTGCCWDEPRHGRRPPPGRQRHAPPPADQEPGGGGLPAGPGRDLLHPLHRAHGRPGMKGAKDKNARVAWTMVAIVGGMLALAYAAVPLYEIFCKATGFGGTPIVAHEGERPILPRTVTVRFDSNVDPNLSWRFQPLQREVKVKLGEEKLVFYRATNVSQRPIVGTATYNVTPEPAGPWFDKVQCFCFTEQLLKPGQSVDMPVVFFVDPAMDKDRRYDNVRTITLSYTFFEAKTERAKTLLGELPADGS